MRIAVVHSEYSNKVPSGENNVVLDQVRALIRAGHEVLHVSRQTPERQLSFILKVRLFLAVSSGFGKSPLRELRRFNPEIVIINNLFPNYSAYWLRKIRAKKIFMIHNYRFKCANAMFFRNNKTCYLCIEKNVLQSLLHRCYKNSVIATLPMYISSIRRKYFFDELENVDVVVALSLGSKLILEKANYPVAKIQVIPNFIAENIHVATPPKLIREGKSIWVACGRLSEEKGFKELVMNWPSEHELDIIGTGPLYDELVLLTHNRSNITLLGKLSREETIVKLRGYTGAILPSLWLEVAPIIALEFLRSGLPIITLTQNVFGEFVSTNGCGIVLDELSRVKLHRSIQLIEEHLTEYRNRAINSFHRDFTESAWTKRMESLFLELLRNS